MKTTLIKNATLFNEGAEFVADLRIAGLRIEQISRDIPANANDNVIDAGGRWLLPGMIDDQVHFREPGMTHKGNIARESRAAVAGGITSFMELLNEAFCGKATLLIWFWLIRRAAHRPPILHAAITVAGHPLMATGLTRKFSPLGSMAPGFSMTISWLQNRL